MSTPDKNSTEYQLHKAIRTLYHDSGSPVRLISVHAAELDKTVRQLLALCERNNVPVPQDLLDRQREALAWIHYGVDEARSHNNAFRDKYLSLNPPELPMEPPPFADISPCERVLIVDDDLLTREIAADLVRSRYYQVDCAANGEEAIAMAMQCQYDLILMDCCMPEVDGFEATHSILAEAEERVPVVVGITAMPREEYFLPGLKAGMQEFIPKPLNQAALDRVLRKYSPHL